MNSNFSRYIIAVIIFGIGAIMAVTPALTQSNFELLIPGVILVAISAPFVYYFRARLKSAHQHKTDEEVITEAKIETEQKRRNR
jgi:Sec-independent protein secretion pathway component TatC